MPADRVRRELTLEINTDLERVNREVAILERNLNQARWAEREARAEGDEHRLSMIRQQRSLEALRREQRAARNALREYADEQREASDSFDQMVMSFNLQTAAFEAGMQVIGGIANKIGEVIDKGMQWSKITGELETQTQRLTEVTDGLFPEQALARLVNYQKELGLTEQQTNAVAKAAVHLGRITGDFGEALETVTDIVLGGSFDELEKLGIIMEGTGTKEEQVAAVTKLITERYGDMNIAVENAYEKSVKFANQQESLEGRMGRTIVQSTAYQKSMETIAKAKEWLIKTTTDTIYYLTELQDEMIYVVKYGFGPFSDAITTVAEALGLADSQLEKFVDGMKGLEKTAVRSSAQVMADLEKETEAIVKGGPKIADEVIKARQKIIDAEQKINDKRRRDAEREKEKAKREKEKEDREAQRKEQRALRYRQQARANYERKLTQLKKDHANQRLQIDKNLAASEEKRLAREAKEHEERIARIEEHTSAFYQAAIANAISAESFGQFMEKMVADSLNYLGQLATKEAIKETALALGSLGMWDFAGAANHFASAAMWGVLGIGGQVAGAAVNSSIAAEEKKKEEEKKAAEEEKKAAEKEKETSSSNSSYRSTSISSSREQETSSKPTQVNNYYIQGRSDLLTRKDIQQISKKLAQGRS